MASHYRIISSEYIPLSTVKKILKKRNKEEMSYEQKMALEHAEEFTKLSEAEAEKLIADLKALNMSKLKDELIVKIADVAPKSRDELKLILSSSRIPFKDDELSQVFDAISKK